MSKCPNLEKCPIYTGILQGKAMTSKAYIQYYCDTPTEAFKTCKRYIVKEQTGKCPPDLLPNSILSVEEIKQTFNL
jgi:hypothetical protein